MRISGGMIELEMNSVAKVDKCLENVDVFRAVSRSSLGIKIRSRRWAYRAN